MEKQLEEEWGRKIDRCLTDGAMKLGGGIAIGTVFSVLFYKRKRWPIILGGGFGIGLAYSNCERDINAFLAETRNTGSCENRKK